ncbi:hypothetical protein [Massilia sp. ZL223]|uniref:hypothetical protein n=1 Tax=Massilia sp. ZL223 TaxID=2824904 RepID=UPI001B83102E|nr:hypothetical protein [Massilia sp. ZL223]MBQ5961756.1 hypothetical protein [Massilia sp. ZL223]
MRVAHLRAPNGYSEDKSLPITPMPPRLHSRCAAFACLLATCAAALAQPAPSPARTAPAAGEHAPAAENKLDIEAMRRAVREMKFDEEVVRRTSDVMSAEPDPGHKRFREKFDSGKRGDCLTAFQGMGVLALLAMPIATLIDKKDHGCKW